MLFLLSLLLYYNQNCFCFFNDIITFLLTIFTLILFTPVFVVKQLDARVGCHHCQSNPTIIDNAHVFVCTFSFCVLSQATCSTHAHGPKKIFVPACQVVEKIYCLHVYRQNTSDRENSLVDEFRTKVFPKTILTNSSCFNSAVIFG